MRKYIIGSVMGLLVSLVFVFPLIIAKVTWLPLWIIPILWAVIGFFIAAVDLRLNPLLKGLLIAFLVSLPMLLLFVWKQPESVLFIVIMVSLGGPMLGFWLGKINTGADAS